MMALSPELQQTLSQFLRDTAQVFNDLDEEALRAHTTPAARPSTSSTVNAMRVEYENALQAVGLVEEVSDTVEKIWDLDPSWAEQILKQHKSPFLSQTELGCWLSVNRPSHPNGYSKINLRNTRRPGRTTELIGCQPYLHQLAIVAGGRGVQLLSTCRGNYEVFAS
jgi:hypothetical protein